MAPLPIAVVTTAMLARAATSNLPIGDGRMPTGAGWSGSEGQSTFTTYGVLYPLDQMRGGPDASIANRYDSPQLHYQITSVGSDRLSAETASDLFVAALVTGVPLPISGQTAVLLIHETSVGVQRDEKLAAPLFYAVDRFRLDVQ